MAATQKAQARNGAAATLDYDAIIIGAGISGMYQLYRLRELGLRVRVFEAGTGVGGTWYWNRYPGARFDSESYTYQYSFSQELLEEWNWSEHFAGQPETLRYLNHVADKFDLRRDIQFRSRVTAAHCQDDTRAWDVTLEDGSRHRARFLDHRHRPAVGADAAAHRGHRRVQGPSFHTARWPHEPVSFAGKRVAVIGTGATGVQTIAEVAKTAGHLTVFQRTPNWCKPLHNGPIDRGDADQDQGQLRRDVQALPGNLRLLHPHARPARHLRGDAGGARGVLREAVRDARLRHVAGQLPRHADQPRGERRSSAISSRARSASASRTPRSPRS